MATVIRVALVDDDPKVVSRIKEELGQASHRFKLIAVLDGTERAVSELPGLKPDIVLMDILFAHGSGVDCVRDIAPQLPRARILMLTVSKKSRHIFESLRAGAHGYLLKRDIDRRLISSLEAIAEGNVDISPLIASKIFAYLREESENKDVLNTLTLREAELLRAVSQGFTNKELAEEFGIKIPTVESHLSSIYEKLHVCSRKEAVLKLRSPFK